jgi:hypothetical protein
MGEEIMKKSEQPRPPRYKGKMAVELGTGKGVTQDFSCSGIFFETNRSFSPGEPIDFTLVLEHIDPAHPVRVTCHGQIVRVEESGQRKGVAASIDSYSFEVIQQAIN